MASTAKSANVSWKQIEVPTALVEGEKFIKWDEDSGGGVPVTLRVDSKGYFIYWTDQNMEVELLDIATIRDVRTGIHAKVPKIRYISVEHPKVTYYKPSHFVFVNLTTHRFGRRNPMYFVDMHMHTLFPFDNRLEVDFYFHEWLTNVYKPTFVEMHFKWCNLVHKDMFFGAALNQGNFTKPCPHPPGYYHLYNMSIPTTSIPRTFPFTKGRILCNMTVPNGKGPREVVGMGYIDMEIKIRYISVEHPKVTSYQPSHFVFMNLTTRRFSRRNPIYFVDMHMHTLFPFDNRLEGYYHLYNMSIPTTSIPRAFPFTKGRILCNLTVPNGKGPREVVAMGYIDMEIKDPKIKNVVLIGSQGTLEEKTVTVCHGADFVNITFINFCCARREIAQMWTEELFKLAYNLNQMTNPTIKFLEKLHTKICLKADKSGKILVKNIVRYFAQNKEDKKKVEKALSDTGLPTGKADTISQSKFQFEDFFAFYKNLTQRNEVNKIFNQLTDGKPHLSATQLVDFLNEVQRDPRLNEILHPYADLQRAKDLIRTYEHNKYHQQKNQLTFDGFLRFLMSEDNPIVQPSKLDLCDDMEQPLAHYFINSSHNTYLTGHQITGKSSVEIYRQSLLAGCRCVELDFWNGRTEEPVIVHGYTFVPEISAKEVLEAIAESAFKTSDFPVILSFENHCNPRQQAKIANYCRDIFGDMLLDKPLDSHQLEPGGELPPPSLLRHKIIIKNKKKHHHHHKKEDSCTSSEGLVQEPAELPQGNGDMAHGALARQGSKESTDSSDSESSSGEEEAAAEVDAEAGEKRETHAGAEISALVNYVQPVHFSSFENAEKKSRFYEMSSFDEKQATTLLKERPIEFVNYNKHQLSRVYPAGTRFDSSNFMPQVFWNAGCQLVALNYQTLDLAMQLNLGTFEYNRRCGYLLKPEFMRRKDRRLDPFAESTVDGIIAGSLSVTVLSGQLLTDKRCGTYVEVDMFGLPADTVRKKFRTRVAPNNGINPVYGEEPFVFKKVVLPELAMIRIAAHEESGRLLGHRVLPVVGLCPGYRHVNLRTELGLPLPASLLLQVVVKDYVPDQLSELAEALANPIKYQSELDKREHQLAVLTEDTDVPPDDEFSKPPPATAQPQVKIPESVIDGSPSKTLTAIVETTKLIEQESVSPTPLPTVAEQTETKEETDSKTNGNSDEHIAETLEALLSSKVVKEKRAELARKLDALRRKFDKDKRPAAKFYVSNKLVKRLSSKNIPVGESSSGNEESTQSELLAAERELRLRYHHAIYGALDKTVRSDQHQQMKTLTDLLEMEKKEILSRLANSRKEDVKALVKKTNRDKDEILRIKREIHSQSVERGVAECSRLEQSYARRREQLARAHERLRALLQKHRDQELVELERLCGGAPEG